MAKFVSPSVKCRPTAAEARCPETRGPVGSRTDMSGETNGGEQRRHFEPAGFGRSRAIRADARPRLERSPKGDSVKSENGGEGGILPQTPEILDRNSLLKLGRVSSDTLNDTSEEIRSQETMRVTMSRKAETFSALSGSEIGDQFTRFVFVTLGSGRLPWNRVSKGSP